MKTITVQKIASFGRIYLGKEVMVQLALDVGDFVQLVEDDGKVFIEKVAPATV